MFWIFTGLIGCCVFWVLRIGLLVGVFTLVDMFISSEKRNLGSPLVAILKGSFTSCLSFDCNWES